MYLFSIMQFVPQYFFGFNLNARFNQTIRSGKITLLRVIPTMTFIHFVTGKSSGILSDHIVWHSTWRSIWHIFWHSSWHIFWHMLWHIFWHSIWHI